MLVLVLQYMYAYVSHVWCTCTHVPPRHVYANYKKIIYIFIYYIYICINNTFNIPQHIQHPSTHSTSQPLSLSPIHLPPTTYYLLLTANDQRPTTNHLLPAAIWAPSWCDRNYRPHFGTANPCRAVMHCLLGSWHTVFWVQSWALLMLLVPH